MFDLDALFVHKDADIAVFLITQKARDFADSVFGAGRSKISSSVEMMVLREEVGVAFRRDCAEHAEIDTHFTDMPYAAAELNARELAIREAQRLLWDDTADYFEPLISTAISERDKAKLTKLFYQLPDAITRASFIDRIKYGPESFAELHEVGATIDNWHKPKEVA